MTRAIVLLFMYSLQLFFPNSSTATNILNETQTITGSQTLVSADGSFESGFFSPSSSNNTYFGIWYKNIPIKTIVWTANRNKPLNDSSGVLKIDESQKIVLYNQAYEIIWFSPSNHLKSDSYVIAQLLDCGNLVLRHESNNDPESYIWQSFDYPSDTLLEGMKLGWNLESGLNRYLSSWMSLENPSLGEYNSSIDRRGFPQLVLHKGKVLNFRAGSWNGRCFTGVPEVRPNSVFVPIFVATEEEVYYSYKRGGENEISRLILSSTGILQRLHWSNLTAEWIEMQTMQKDKCDEYNICGAYATCNLAEIPLCTCLQGFTPKSLDKWNQSVYSDGCTRNTPLSCEKDEFLKISNMKLPDTSKCWVNKSMSRAECRVKCLRNCTCIAYSDSNVTSKRSGCIMWFGDLVDVRKYTFNGQDFYIRMAASELEKINESSKKKKRTALVVTASMIFGMLLLGIFWCLRARKKTKGNMRYYPHESYANKSEKREFDFPTFSFLHIEMATNNFALENKLGEGGFGPVYKGVLANGKEIAVKRLSKTSGQGIKEFKNEVILIAKLQHRNLVRLLGCCIQRDETMLIYEYMANKSLDSFIFDRAKSSLISWQKRFNIILGTAQGLVYLHRDSRLRIIHRDLKASNVLLDSEMNPKISDFGMAKIFRGDQTEANTERVVGTYGYMSPEYAIDGHFSLKSDVFSFGVLVLEIISGKRNRGFAHLDHYLNLLGHTWNLWNEGKALELIDTSLGDNYLASEALKCIHVGLLCVQQRPEDRPNMPYVVLMLSSEIMNLPEPKQPGFYNERCLVDMDSTSSGKRICSTDITTTMIQGR